MFGLKKPRAPYWRWEDCTCWKHRRRRILQDSEELIWASVMAILPTLVAVLLLIALSQMFCCGLIQ